MREEFHEISLKSILFKGRGDMYFCYLKAEKIAHVLCLLEKNSQIKDSQFFDELVTLSTRLPHVILHFVAGEIEPAIVLADIFSLLSSIRLSATQGYIRKENTFIIAEEYESLATRIAAENHPSPFVSSKDFLVEEIKSLPTARFLFPEGKSDVINPILDKNIQKDIEKGHIQSDRKHSERMSLILDFVRKNKGVSIKDIASVVRGCSEKTIQRELAQLIEKGLIERRGERRWSTYIATPPKS